MPIIKLKMIIAKKQKYMCKLLHNCDKIKSKFQYIWRNVMVKEQRNNANKKNITKKRKQIKKRRPENDIPVERLDFKITIGLIFLCAFGLLMVYSASYYSCLLAGDKATELVKKQFLFMLLGIAVIFVARYIDYRILRKLSVAIYLVAFASIWLLIPFGVEVNDAKRWLEVKGVRLQVAELVKIAVIIALAAVVYRYYNALGSWNVTVIIWLVGGVPAIVLWRISDDLSSSLVILGITFLVSFICMRTWKMHLGLLLIAILLAGIVVLYVYTHMPDPASMDDSSVHHIIKRIAAWIDVKRYSTSIGYQQTQGMYAIASGGWFGKGFGNSVQKLGALPEAHNDMIFSVICEELGLFGAVVLILLLTYMIFQIAKVAVACKDMFGSVLVLGVFLHIGLQSFVNIAVNVNFFPNTGISLPFISYGGTAIFFQLCELAMVYSVERYHRLQAVRRIMAEEQRLQGEENGS